MPDAKWSEMNVLEEAELIVATRRSATALSSRWATPAAILPLSDANGNVGCCCAKAGRICEDTAAAPIPESIWRRFSTAVTHAFAEGSALYQTKAFG